MVYDSKKWLSLFVLNKNCLTFVVANGYALPIGTLDEWLSQWSAKPCTAVRIRQVPQKKEFVRTPFFVSYIDIIAGILGLNNYFFS